ncbi:hypothetical protein, partial [Flagellimonas sp. 2504JD4-2]
MIQQLLFSVLSILFLERKEHLFHSTLWPRGVKGVCLLFFLISSSYTVLGQDIECDTWFAADRAVNAQSLPYSPSNLYLLTPFSPTDGTVVEYWSDLVDFTPQDAYRYPTNPLHYPNAPAYPNEYPAATDPGFEYSAGSYINLGLIAPAGNPTLQRNEMNFNPVIEFDGSDNGGVGQALHFRSSTRNDITVFIVFRGQGAGNSADTQRLLFGGDMDSYTAANTNLSLGISDGNRFSIGRTWRDGGTNQSYFQSGGIDLNNEPTIGVFTRNYSAGDDELDTWVNGLHDIDLIYSGNDAGDSFFYFNSIGRHFNSNDANRNLTGQIAEILLVDDALTSYPNEIIKAESYLAIKYGITLARLGGLGSSNGNDSYSYLAADGTVIWAPHIQYRFDIAGIGVDRHDDVNIGGGDEIKLRYNLDQRISKSVNTDAIVTISTGPDFISGDDRDVRDDDSIRPHIDGDGRDYDHNYLLWASDRASLTSTVTELPSTGLLLPGPVVFTPTERIAREWKVQKNTSGGETPIYGVSVRVELSGSDIICPVYLAIDTDGNGDFTDGPITYIEAASIDVGNSIVYFDNVNFEDEEVFTIVHSPDITPPTGTIDNVVVCDSIPAVDTTDVYNLDDNCEVDTVTHQGDVSDGLINPETITRTYRITDTSGNFTDVQQTIQVYTTPNAGSNNSINICENDTSVDLFASLGGADAGGSWSDDNFTGVDLTDPTNVDFTGITVGNYDFTYTVTAVNPICPNDSATVTVSIDAQATVAAAGPDIAQCNNGNFTMAANAPTVGTGSWSLVLGTATITTPASETTTVTGLALGDSATLRWTITNGSCMSTDDVVITNHVQPFADAPANVESCDSYTLPALTNGNYFGGPGGTGTAYSAGDVISTSTTLYVYSAGTGSCPDVENSFDVTINVTPLADAPANVESCDSYTLPALTNGNYFGGPGGTGTAYSAGDVIS